MFHNAFVSALLAFFALPDEEAVRALLKEGDLFVDWFASQLQRAPYDPSKKASFWIVCTYGHLYKILVESQKLKMGVFDDPKTEDPKLRHIFDEFLAPKIIAETKEYSKERANLSEIIEPDDEHDPMLHSGDEPTRKFTDTHFPTDFKVTLTEELDGQTGSPDLKTHDELRKDSDDDMVQIDKSDLHPPKSADDLAHWKAMMAYSNRQIEDFLNKKAPGSESSEDKAVSVPPTDDQKKPHKDE